MRVSRRYFTVEEANAAVARVRPLVEELVAHRGRLRDLGARWNELAGRIAGNGGGLERTELADLGNAIEREQEAVERVTHAVEAHGAQVKDLDIGLVDFPALRRGQEVLLCWQLGEDEIAFWHTVEDGFAGRRPLPLD